MKHLKAFLISKYMSYKVWLVWIAWASFQSTGAKPKWSPLWNFTGVKTVLAASLGSITEFSCPTQRYWWPVYMDLWHCDLLITGPRLQKKGEIILRPHVRSGQSFIHFLTSLSPTPIPVVAKALIRSIDTLEWKSAYRMLTDSKKIICAKTIYIDLSPLQNMFSNE